jgi:RNA polymerase sigma-70 factor (ECF subfamily)
MQGDAELLAAWRDGDAQAGRELFERHFSVLYRFFYNKMEDSIEDMIQETLLTCVEARDRIRDDASFRAFLLGIARNRLYKRWRRLELERRHFDPATASVASMGITPSQVVAVDEQRDVVLTAMREIPVDMQTALELYYVEDLTAPEIATVLEIPEGTVRSRIRRGREQLGEVIVATVKGSQLPAVDDASLTQWGRVTRDRLTLAGGSTPSATG